MKEYLSDYSHNRIQGHVNGSAYGNMGESIPWPNVGDVHAEFLRSNRIKQATCGNCPIGCKSVIRLPDGRSSFVKCTSWFVFMSASKVQDFMFSLECFNRCERYGLDSTSTANLIAFAIELFQKGILSEKDTEGFRLDWGNPAAVFSLIEKIARREGIGDMLADGVHAAAGRINCGAEKQAFHVKGLELSPFPLYTPYLAYAAALSDRADMMKALGQSLTQRMSDSQEEKEKYIGSGFFPYPEEFRKYLWQPVEWAGEDYERYAQCISYETDKITLSDCMGTCIYWTGHYPFPPFQYGDMAELISHATGMEMDEDGLMKTTRRVSNLIRAYHLLSGLRKKDDTVPEKFFNEPPPPPEMALSEKKIERMHSEYYRTRGWDDNGVPKKETLDELGLDDVRRALEQKGILSP
jgi:aldehyde:ferredoxin oxidoreductase